MRIELRDKPEEKKEPVAKVWLERESSGSIALYYQIDGDDFSNSLAYFNEEEKRFHVFGYDARKLGYRVTATNVNIQEE